MSFSAWWQNVWKAATGASTHEEAPAWEQLLPTAPRTFFAGKNTLDFSNTTGPDWRDAWLLAELSVLAYWNHSEIRAIMRQLDPEQWTVRTLVCGASGVDPGEGPVQALLVTSATTAAVVFRGTRLSGFPGLAEFFSFTAQPAINLADLGLDLTFMLQEVAPGQPKLGQVHRGMLNAYRTWRAEFHEVLRGSLAGRRQLWFAGHSLGAALAAQCALDHREAAPAALYTFGCPRFCNAAFAATFAGLPVYRFVHRKDFVTSVPPPIGLNAALTYTHAGDLLWLDGRGSPPGPGRQPEVGDVLFDIVTGAPASWAANLAGFRIEQLGRPFNPRIRAGALSDHAPKYYADELKKIAGA